MQGEAHKVNWGVNLGEIPKNGVCVEAFNFMLTMNEKQAILAEAGWTMTRIGRSGKELVGIISTYFFSHKETGRVMQFTITENVVQGTHKNTWVGDGAGAASDRMIAHLRGCEEQLVQKR